MVMRFDLSAVKEAAAKYKHKAKVLRQIHSEKLSLTSRWLRYLNITTIIVSAFTTFLAFFGVDKVHALFLWCYPLAYTEFFFNLVVLLLLIVAFLQMTLRVSELSYAHLTSVKKLTEFIADIDEILRVKSCAAGDCFLTIKEMKNNYKSVINTLPQSSDKEWEKAKIELSEKDKK